MMTRPSQTSSVAVAACLLAVLSSSLLPSTTAFSNALFQQAPNLQRTLPSLDKSQQIEMPDFDELFERIQQVSPLARSVISGSNQNRGLGAVLNDDEQSPSNLKWKTIEKAPKKKDKGVHQIEKIENFQGLKAPLLRFRSTVKGPLIGECFANFITTLEHRSKWDDQIQDVQEVHTISDTDAVNIAMGFGRYGDCAHVGVGYCQTKASLGITPREQLTLCGLQDFADGSCVIWGTEMPTWCNQLMPAGKPSHTRAKSHLFATTLTPTSDESFDVEYVLQLEIGGKLPTWLTTPIVTDNVKKMFAVCEDFFEGKCGELQLHLQEMQRQTDNMAAAVFGNDARQSLLMTP